jgi:hypothetical protein
MTRGEVEEGTTAQGAEEDGVAVWVWRAVCQWSGSRSASCPTGVVGSRVRTSCKYAHGSTPRRWHVDLKLISTAAVWPPRGNPTRERVREKGADARKDARKESTRGKGRESGAADKAAILQVQVLPCQLPGSDTKR